MASSATRTKWIDDHEHTEVILVVKSQREDGTPTGLRLIREGEQFDVKTGIAFIKAWVRTDIITPSEE